MCLYLSVCTGMCVFGLFVMWHVCAFLLVLLCGVHMCVWLVCCEQLLTLICLGRVCKFLLVPHACCVIDCTPSSVVSYAALHLDNLHLPLFVSLTHNTYTNTSGKHTERAQHTVVTHYSIGNSGLCCFSWLYFYDHGDHCTFARV